MTDQEEYEHRIKLLTDALKELSSSVMQLHETRYVEQPYRLIEKIERLNRMGQMGIGIACAIGTGGTHVP